jgi:hypothetical protein
MIGKIQFHFHIAVTDKSVADRIANSIREHGSLARVQKKPIKSTFGKKRKTVSHCWVVFEAHPKKLRR